MTVQPAAHTWIDKIAAVFNIEDGKGGRVRSYKQADLKELPDAITSDQVPCVVHHIRDCQPLYSLGGPTILFWEGVSQFHLFEDIKAANWSEALPYFPRILAAAMGNVKLNGTVDTFMIPEQPRAIWFVTFRRIDGSDDHDGIQVTWTVKQTVTGSYTVSA